MTNLDQKPSAGRNGACIELPPSSFTMRVGKCRLTLRRRARMPMPNLLHGLLRRSWRAMFGNTLRISMTAAAICVAWNVPAMAAGPVVPPLVNTLPTGGVITSGNATITQTGNVLNINQSSSQAIGNFTTFSIGANAEVDINQTNAANAFLARVTGSDPSLIYGLLKSNGVVALINQNGIMVGPGGVVDVARFIASTLKVSDSDFLAGRLAFNSGAGAGNIDNQGTIKTPSGGSVYLIGANVSNSGLIQSPNGEILLGAGETVQLLDTGTPGVSVNVTGNAGKVTNLSNIAAEAGSIGIAAGLINNNGNINASNVVSDGGRIFLRASQNLTTTASSTIAADGANQGGNVVLYSAGAAYIDGAVSAQGAPGKGGYVETSGLTSLDVVNLPAVGSGGTWYIDPYDLTVVADNVGNQNSSISGGAITSSGGMSTIKASDINALLNADTNVTLATGDDGGQSGGNITINAAIIKSSGTYARLELDADNNIYINANITSTSGMLDLDLLSNFRSLNNALGLVQVSGATIALNGGLLNVSDGIGGFQNGNLFIQGTVNLIDMSGSTGTLNNDGVLNITNSTIATTGGFTNNADGTVNANYQTVLNTSVVNNGTMSLDSAANTPNGYSGGSTVTLMQGVTNNGVLTMLGTIVSDGDINNNSGGSIQIGTISRTTSLSSDNWLNGGNLSIASGSAIFSDGNFDNSGNITLTAGDLVFGSFTNDIGARSRVPASSISVMAMARSTTTARWRRAVSARSVR